MADKHQEEVSFLDRLIAQLDKDQPRWYIDWATGSELLHYSEMCSGYSEFAYPSAVEALQHIQRARNRLKEAVANRLFHRILNAALSAGIIKE